MGKGSDSQHDENKKYTYRVYFHHLAENRLEIVANPFHFISEHPAAIVAILPRSSRSCRDRRDPAAIVAILPRSCCDNRNT